MRYVWVTVVTLAGCGGTSNAGLLGDPPDGGHRDGAADAPPRYDAGAPDPEAGADGPAGVEACVPACPKGMQCGVADDGCGSQRQCGTCQSPDTCGGGGEAGACGCTPAACVSGQNCGSVPDNCGHTEQCGDCPITDYCTSGACDTFANLGCQPIAECSMVPPTQLCVWVNANNMVLATYECPMSAKMALMQADPPCNPSVNTPNFWNCCSHSGC